MTGIGTSMSLEFSLAGTVKGKSGIRRRFPLQSNWSLYSHHVKLAHLDIRIALLLDIGLVFRELTDVHLVTRSLTCDDFTGPLEF